MNYRICVKKISAFTLLCLSINGFVTVAQAEGVKAPASAPTPLTTAPNISSNDNLSALEAQWQAKHQALKTVLFDGKELYSNLSKDKQAAYVLQARENLTFAETHFGQNSKQVAYSLLDLTRMMSKYHDDQSREARALLSIAFEIWHKQFGKDISLFEEIISVSNSMLNLAMICGTDTSRNLQEKIKFRLSLERASQENFAKENMKQFLYVRALPLLEKELGTEHAVVVKHYERLASFYARLSKDSFDVNEVSAFYHRVIALLEKNPQANPEALANILHGFAQFVHGQKNLSEAADLYVRELAIREQYLSNQGREIEEAMTSLVGVYEGQKKYAQAISFAQKLLAIAEKKENKNQDRLFNVTWALDRLAQLHVQQKTYHEAHALYLKKLAMFEAETTPNFYKIFLVLEQLRDVNKNMQRYDQAEVFGVKQLTLAEKKHDDSNVRRALNGLAELYIDQKLYGKAEAIYFRVLALIEKDAKNDPYSSVFVLNDLSELYIQMKRYDDAEKKALHVLAVFENGPKNEDVRAKAFAYMNLAVLYQQKQQFNQAEATYLKALQVYDNGRSLSFPQEFTVIAPHILDIYWRDFKSKNLLRLLSLYQQTNQKEKIQTLKAKY